MFKFSLSVRAYYTGRKYGLPCVEKWSEYSDSELAQFCGRAGIATIINGRGLKTAIELFRASGMGVHAICETLANVSAYADRISLDRVKMLCNQFDYKLHESLN